MFVQTRTRASRKLIALPSGRFLLGAITADEAAEQIFPQARVGKNAGHNAATRQQIVSSAAAGQVMAYAPGSGDCQGVSLVKPALAKTVGGMALKFVPQAFAAGPIVGGVVLAIAGLGQLFGAIFGHHAAAVGKERSILCTAVPAANQSIELIDQMVASGQQTPQQGMSALDAVVSGFQSAVAPIIHGADPMASGECNAACVMLSDFRAIVLVKKSQYQDLANASQAGPAAAAFGGNLSSLVPWAAAGLGLWLVLKEA